MLADNHSIVGPLPWQEDAWGHLLQRREQDQLPHGLLLRGKITHCEARPEGGFEVGIEFIDMVDAQRQLLARYILQRQQQQRRQQLEQNAPSS